MSTTTRHVAVLAAALASATCVGPAPEYRTLTDIDQLQRAFNAGEGKVRAIFLASPT